MLNLNMTENDKVWDIGHGDLYSGTQYEYPYFFETVNTRMMKDIGENTIDFKTWKGEFFQFYIDRYHGNQALYLTSTLLDCCVFQPKRLSVAGMKEWAKSQSENKRPVKGSYTGYFSFGKKLLTQLELLESHMEEQEIYFSDEVLERAFNELMRRAQ